MHISELIEVENAFEKLDQIAKLSSGGDGVYYVVLRDTPNEYHPSQQSVIPELTVIKSKFGTKDGSFYAYADLNSDGSCHTVLIKGKNWGNVITLDKFNEQVRGHVTKIEKASGDLIDDDVEFALLFGSPLFMVKQWLKIVDGHVNSQLPLPKPKLD